MKKLILFFILILLVTSVSAKQWGGYITGNVVYGTGLNEVEYDSDSFTLHSNPPIEVYERGDDEVRIRATNVQGNTYDFPYVEVNSYGLFRYGEDDFEKLHFAESYSTGNDPDCFEGDWIIRLDDKFLLWSNEGENSYSHVVEFENVNPEEQVLTFTDLATGPKKFTYKIIDNCGGTGAGDLILGGNIYKVWVSPGSGESIVIDLNGDGDVAGDETKFATKSGHVIDLGEYTSGSIGTNTKIEISGIDVKVLITAYQGKTNIGIDGTADVKCTDSDGRDFYNKGYVEEPKRGKSYDVCAASGQLYEKLCNENPDAFSPPEYLETYGYDCPNGCKDGACVDDNTRLSNFNIAIDGNSPVEDVKAAIDLIEFLKSKGHVEQTNPGVIPVGLTLLFNDVLYDNYKEGSVVLIDQERALTVIGDNAPTNHVLAALDSNAFLTQKGYKVKSILISDTQGKHPLVLLDEFIGKIDAPIVILPDRCLVSYQFICEDYAFDSDYELDLLFANQVGNAITLSDFTAEKNGRSCTTTFSPDLIVSRGKFDLSAACGESFGEKITFTIIYREAGGSFDHTTRGEVYIGGNKVKPEITPYRDLSAKIGIGDTFTLESWGNKWFKKCTITSLNVAYESFVINCGYDKQVNYFEKDGEQIFGLYVNNEEFKGIIYPDSQELVIEKGILIHEMEDDEFRCPIPSCAAPPDNCWYERSDKTDANGCLVNPCGILECEEVYEEPNLDCPIPSCAAPPENCYYERDYTKNSRGCPKYPCGKLVCGDKSGERPPMPPETVRETSEKCNGCQSGDRCYDVGIRVKGNYCDLDTNFKLQKKAGEKCENSFECTTNQCSSGSCVDLQAELKEQRSLIQGIMDFLKKLNPFS